jgi:hypothetical protein
LQVRSVNLEKDVTEQLEKLQKCNGTLYREPELLRALSPNEVLAYFGRCWRGVWHDHVTNILPYVCIRSWLAAGFRKDQFMLVRQERLRRLRADVLLPALSNFTGLHHNRAVLDDRGEELRAHCEAPDIASASAKEHASASGARRRKKAPRQHSGWASEHNETDDLTPMVNTHSQYTGHNATQRTQLSAHVLAELVRLADVHHQLLNELGLHEL